MSHTFDNRDARILYALDLDSRQSYLQLSKTLSMSQNAIRYRVEHLIREGIIKTFQTVVDIGKLGYISFRLYLRLKNATPQQEEALLDWLKHQPIVAWIVSIEGRYDIGMLVLTRDVAEMNAFWQQMIETHVNIIDDRLLTIMARVDYYSRAYLIGKEANDYEIAFITEPTTPDTDETDLRILATIATDARKAIIDIARELDLSAKTVIARIRSLEKRKIILGYRMMIDRQKIGYEYVKILIRLQNSTPARRRELRNFIKWHPNIIYNDEVLGGEDVEIELEVQDMAHLRTIIDDMRTRFASIIADHDVMRFYKEHKYVYLPMDLCGQAQPVKGKARKEHSA
ncbi:MAG: Lrp/AsnC family transcriptional regulator [Nanoarchaeota archaeon]